VREILDKANVEPSTFYSHYETKDQLLIAGPENLGVTFFEFNSTRKADQNHEALHFLPLFQHAAQNFPLAKAMLGRKGGDILFGHVENHISKMITEKFKHEFGKTKQGKIELQYCSRAAAAAVMGFMVEWLEDDAKMSVEEIARLCSRAVTGFFKAVTAKRSLG